MFKAGNYFKAGVSGAPVTDWLLYDTHYTERYLNHPKANTEGYEQSSVFPYTADLSGPLMVYHGMADDNVLFTNTTKLIKTLQDENKQFEMRKKLYNSNIDKFRPLYDEYLDITNEHLDAAVEYIRMLPESQFRLKASTMLPVLIGQRTVTLLRTGNILNSRDRIKVTRDEIKSYARKLLRALIIPGGVKRLLEKNKDA